jgi:hypothetical protein
MWAIPTWLLSCVVRPVFAFTAVQWVIVIGLVTLSNRAWKVSIWRQMAWGQAIIQSVFYLIPPSPVATFLLGVVGTAWAYSLALANLKTDERKVTDYLTNTFTTQRFFIVDNWFAKKFLQWTTNIPIGYEPTISYPNPMEQSREWKRRLYDRVRPQAGMNEPQPYHKMEFVAQTDTSVGLEAGYDMNKRILEALDAIVDKVDRLAHPPQTHPMATKYEYICYDTLPVYSEMPNNHSTYVAGIKYLDEDLTSTQNESGAITFNSRCAASIFRVVRKRKGVYEGWATASKIGDKLSTVAHADSDVDNIVLGKPMVDDEGNTLLVEVRLADGKMVRFPLVPYYRSKGHQRDMVLCAMPRHLQSLVPGLRARRLDPEHDVEIAIMGYPVTGDELKFSTSRVKDRNHMAGSAVGMSGSPILAQGRVVLGVHEGVTNGSVNKRFHSFTVEDIEAIRSPAPSIDLELELETPLKNKKKGRRYDRFAMDFNWADDDEEMDFSVDPMSGLKYHEAGKGRVSKPLTPPTSPKASRNDKENVLESLLTLLREAGTTKVEPVVEQVNTPTPKKKKNKGKKVVKPCQTILSGKICEDTSCELDHKLAANMVLGQVFQRGPVVTGQGGTAVSSGSMA